MSAIPSRSTTQRQREAIMRLLPASVGQIAKALKTSDVVARRRIKKLELEQAVQIVGETAGKVQIWGWYTGVPYVHQRAKPLPIPKSPHKTRWIGGHYPGVY